MNYELLYIKLIKKIDNNIKALDSLIIDPKVENQAKDKYLMAKVWLKGLREQAQNDLMNSIIE